MVDITDTQNKPAAAAPEIEAAERKPLPRWVITVASIAVVLILWEIFGRRVNPVFGSYPSAIAVAFWELAVSGQLWSALYDSLRPFLLGYALAIVIGVPGRATTIRGMGWLSSKMLSSTGLILGFLG